MEPTTNESTYHINLGHQEVDRLIEELEKLYDETPAEWLAVEPVAKMMYLELGYEDKAEFEDALNGTFEQFLGALPNVELEMNEKGFAQFKFKPEPPQEEWKPKKFSVRITDTTQLWNVCLKSPHARVEIPELEFEFGVDRRRRIDTIYNYVASAVFNLATHVEVANLSEDHKEKTIECLSSLNALLDVAEPWTWVVHDPSGLSEFTNMKDVVVEDLE
ncbi:hypothetical protein K493DRAFT_312591 [Basidiobolus meristosporus CBS 931.73]|uniref:Zinc finger ZPR1-type domain-containing protein n=1 Tax=Basidiobolus meristosporus CBS 931.73 TaxID=1314790 RepID=A0A1Y1YSJ4_9FUNG|nr:hypothetical protein K493DRAFT_312591 [Basidiobolus meristosporus CBS 931.73]|eukprot:ORY00990.1 hypothetical protein K493DRAFT_312591 [Basidiobolus meristosporus CBS 931.73]